MLRRVSISFALFLTSCFAGQLMAAQSDLGSSFPNTPDVSLSPNWHVYVFHQNGVEYVQVNDLQGIVHQVVATAGGQFLVLPMGVDATRVVTQRKATAQAQAISLPSQIVYRDGLLSVAVAVDASGNSQWKNAAMVNCGPPNCVDNQQPVGGH